MKTISKKKLAVALAILLMIGCSNARAEDSPAVDPVTNQNNLTQLSKTGGSITMDLSPQYSILAAESPSDLNVLLNLRGVETGVSKRQPMDLAVVIDRSGSMSGAKLASVKIAALELLNELNSADTVTLISYDHNVSVHSVRTKMNAAGRQQLRNKISRIRVGGTTALGPAMIKALNILSKKKTSKDALRHVMLLSDGLANEGETSPMLLGKRAAQAFKNGVSLSTLGVGVGYNEDLMTHLADQGGGQYHFIEKNSEIARVLEAEFDGLMATVAREMILEIASAKGVAIKDVFGYPLTKEGKKSSIRIGSVRAGGERDIVMRLAISPSAPPSLSLGEMKLRFKDVTNDSTWTEIIADLSLIVSNDRIAVINSENTIVTVRVAEVESARELELAARSVDHGNYANAEKVIDNSIYKLKKQAKKTPSKKLDSQIVEMEQAKKDISKAKTSSFERKKYVKGKKSSAYKRGKSSKVYTPKKKMKKSSDPFGY